MLFRIFIKFGILAETSNNHNIFPWQAWELRHSSNWSSQYSWIFSEMLFIFELQDCPQILAQSRIFNDFLAKAVFSGNQLQNENRPAPELLIELDALRVTWILRQRSFWKGILLKSGSRPWKIIIFMTFRIFMKFGILAEPSNNHNFFPWQATELRHTSNESSQLSLIFSEMRFIFELQN